jgi:hypothetical protein
MHIRKVLILFLPFLLVACAIPVKHNNASGKPEVTIKTSSVKSVRTKATEMMVNGGYRTVRSDDMSITFDKIINDGGMANFLLGSRYDMNPAARVNYTFLDLGKSVRVIADLSVITNPGSGYERRTDFNNSQDSLFIQQELNGLKSRIEGR